MRILNIIKENLKKTNITSPFIWFCVLWIVVYLCNIPEESNAQNDATIHIRSETFLKISK